MPNYSFSPDGPYWDDLNSLISDIHPGNKERALARFKARQPSLVFNDAALEGNTFTEPEVVTLLDGLSVRGRSSQETDQVLSLSKAADYVLKESADGEVEPNLEFSNKVNELIARHEAIDAGFLRGTGPTKTDMARPLTVRVMGEQYAAPTPAEVPGLFEASRERVADITHPLLHGICWSACAIYFQFYFDGNKRTSRYVANAVLISHGFDSILVPRTESDAYHQTLATMFKTGNATDYLKFLISLYDPY
jgi:Fic family protein